MKFNTEFTIICSYWRTSIGRPGSKSCIVLVPFIDSCKIIGEGWRQSARMEITHKYCIRKSVFHVFVEQFKVERHISIESVFFFYVQFNYFKSLEKERVRVIIVVRKGTDS